MIKTNTIFFCSTHIICLYCYHKHSKCSTFILTHIVRW